MRALIAERASHKQTTFSDTPKHVRKGKQLSILGFHQSCDQN